jgi:biotin carboxyl carrier protein
MNISFWIDQEEFRLNLEEKGNNIIHISVGQRKYVVFVEFLSAEELLLNINGKVHNVIISPSSASYSVFVNGRSFRVDKNSALRILREGRGRQRRREVKTTMPGRIVKIMAEEGQQVETGQAVLVLEAMKMQNEIKSPQSGKIIALNVAAGNYVEADAALFSVE